MPAQGDEYAALRTSFLEALPEYVDAVRQAVRAQDRDQMRAAAHKLKGTSGSFGVGEVSELAGRIEHLLAEAADRDLLVEEKGAIDQIVSDLEEHCRRVSAE